MDLYGIILPIDFHIFQDGYNMLKPPSSCHVFVATLMAAVHRSFQDAGQGQRGENDGSAGMLCNFMSQSLAATLQ